jgi:hypothetical protein
LGSQDQITCAGSRARQKSTPQRANRTSLSSDNSSSQAAPPESMKGDPALIQTCFRFSVTLSQGVVTSNVSIPSVTPICSISPHHRICTIYAALHVRHSHRPSSVVPHTGMPAISHREDPQRSHQDVSKLVSHVELQAWPKAFLGVAVLDVMDPSSFMRMLTVTVEARRRGPAVKRVSVGQVSLYGNQNNTRLMNCIKLGIRFFLLLS